MNPPVVDCGFLSKQPNLIGVAKSKPDHWIDLRDGVITYHPGQQVHHFMSGSRSLVESWPRTYTLTFQKRRKQDAAWVRWFAANPEIAFRVNNVEFRLEAVTAMKRVVRYRAAGYESSATP